MSPETRQQVIALVLGLVFIIGFVLFAQRIGQFLRDRQQSARVASGQTSPTLTPTPIAMKVTPVVTRPTDQVRKPSITPSKSPETIPNTGMEVIVLSGMGSMLGLGFLINRYSRKQ